MKNINIIIAGFFYMFILSSCLTTRDTNLLKDSGNSTPKYSKAVVVDEYRIKPGDELQITISASLESKTEQLFTLFSSRNSVSGNTTSGLRTSSVAPDGTIYFPYLGNINVSGKTTLEIRQLMEEMLNANIAKDCFVQVSLVNRYFSVIGESNSGRYPIAKEQTTIYQALAQSRDIFPYGDRSKVKIIRQTDLGTVVRVFDLKSSDVVNSEFYYIQPDDVIYIQPMNKQFWGINSFGAFFTLITTVASIGVLVYSLVK